MHVGLGPFACSESNSFPIYSKVIELIHSRTREKLLQTLPRDLSGVKFHFEMCNTFDDFAGMVNLRLDETAK